MIGRIRLSLLPSDPAVETCLPFRLRTLICTPHLHSPKPRWTRSMPRSHHLLWLPFPAVRRTPQCPVITRANRVHRIPELGCNSAVGGILEHAGALAVSDFPSDFGAELEVVALVVNGPRTVGLKQNAVIGGPNQLIESQRLLAGENTDIGHADDRQPVPTLSAQSSSGTIQADDRCSLARTEKSGEQPVRDDRSALCRNTFVVECKRSESRPVLLASVGDYVYQLAAVFQVAQLV